MMIHSVQPSLYSSSANPFHRGQIAPLAHQASSAPAAPHFGKTSSGLVIPVAGGGGVATLDFLQALSQLPTKLELASPPAEGKATMLGQNKVTWTDIRTRAISLLNMTKTMQEMALPLDPVKRVFENIMEYVKLQMTQSIKPEQEAAATDAFKLLGESLKLLFPGQLNSDGANPLG